MTVTEEKSEGHRAMVKVHYEGYSNDCDEWRYEEELEYSTRKKEIQHPTPCQPYNVYNALHAIVKLALKCKVSRAIKI